MEETDGISTVPAIIASVAFFHLYQTGRIYQLQYAFFEELEIIEQIGLLSLLFCIIHFAVSISTYIGPDSKQEHSHDHSHDHDDSHSYEPPEKSANKYPLVELAAAATDMEKFKLIFPGLRDELFQHSIHKISFSVLTPDNEVLARLKKMMDYVVPGGNLNVGMDVVFAHRAFIEANENRKLTHTEFARVSVLGWAVQFLQAFFMVACDVIDKNETRGGQTCWYKTNKVGLVAIRDSFMLESFVFTLIKMYYGDEHYYLQLVELLLEVVQKKNFGQLFDLTSQPLNSKEETDLSRFTTERYALMVKHNTTFNTFYLPIAIGMITSGVTNPEEFQLAQEICVMMGEYSQIQDDYLDCYGDPKAIEKNGTDIQENKCSWLLVQALNRATPEQRKVLNDNYGSCDEEKVFRCKKMYDDLKLEEVFAKYKEDSFQQIQAELKKSTLIPREVFEIFLNKIYKRTE